MSVPMIFAMAVCFGVPLAALAYFLVRDRRCAVAFGLGVAGFFVSQIVLRTPLLGLAGQTAWFTVFAATAPFAYALLLAATAALFEEPARYLLLRTRRTLPFSLSIPIAYGLGHGGLEAALMGSAMLVLPTSDVVFFLGGVERLATIMVHVALSLMVYAALMRRRPAAFIAALIVHTAINLTAFLPAAFGVSPFAFEAAYLVVAAALFVFTIKWTRGQKQAYEAGLGE